MPHLSQFRDADSYFAALFHELVHATGHPRRLDRFSHEEGNPLERYSFEELVAEFGAAFLGALCGIRTPELDDLQPTCSARIPRSSSAPPPPPSGPPTTCAGSSLPPTTPRPTHRTRR